MSQIFKGQNVKQREELSKFILLLETSNLISVGGRLDARLDPSIVSVIIYKVFVFIFVFALLGNIFF